MAASSITLRSLFQAATALIAVVVSPGCSDDTPSGDVEVVEELTETVANRLIEFSDALRKRDFAKASTYLAADFSGTGWAAANRGR